MIFLRQKTHLILLLVLVVGIYFLLRIPGTTNGELYGISTLIWIWIAILIPIIHQVYVWLVWRLELHQQFFSKRLRKQTFPLYLIIFFTLFFGRFISILLVAEANKGSLGIPEMWGNTLGSLLLIPVVYLIWSVAKYFGFQRAAGKDHFDKKYRNKPLVKKGLFKYTRNGMYIFGFLALWAVAFFYLSKAALIVALFNHLYIWVHYYCTELPDMKIIYGTSISKP